MKINDSAFTICNLYLTSKILIKMFLVTPYRDPGKSKSPKRMHDFNRENLDSRLELSTSNSCVTMWLIIPPE